jgi:hypothetical protein
MELADNYVFFYFLEVRYQFIHLNTAALITFSYSCTVDIRVFIHIFTRNVLTITIKFNAYY